MDQNQTADNQIVENQAVDNELQKAIDDITNTTNVDPVFSDPVAAPSSVPEGDTGELSEPVGPFPAPEPAPEQPAPAEPAPMPEPMPQVEMTPPAPEPIAPVDPITIPNLEAPEPAPVPEPAPTPEPTPAINLGAAPAPAIEQPSFNFGMSSANLNMHQVKEAALRDLVPLIDRLNMIPSQKFNLYRNIFEQLKDYTVLEPAYRAASEITNDTERAEALLYLVESIDRM